ncbi:1183_t:CDS:2, partial [Funneliformis mosseae]
RISSLRSPLLERWKAPIKPFDSYCVAQASKGLTNSSDSWYLRSLYLRWKFSPPLSLLTVIALRKLQKDLQTANERDLNSIFDHFTPINFYKRFDLSYLQRDLAEQGLCEFLTRVATGNSKYKEKAKDILQNLHLSIKSRSVEEYWERIKILKLKRQLHNTKKLKYLEEKAEILDNEKREQLDNQRIEVGNFSDCGDNLIDREEISQQKARIRKQI